MSYVANCPISYIDTDGLAGTNFSQELEQELESMCNRCFCEASDKAACVTKAKAVGRDLQDLWDRNYRKPGNPFEHDAENSGGFMCYDWAAAFARIIGTSGPLQATVIEMNGPVVGIIQRQHYAIKITAGSSGKDNCRVFIDDGFLVDGTVHGVNGAKWNTPDWTDTHSNRFNPGLPRVPGSQGPF
jgi:hypothetical protein